MTDVLAAQVEMAALRKQARDARRAFARSRLGPFAKAMLGAMADYDRVRREGVSHDDASRGLEAVLRESWPGKTSKFAAVCDACDDTGYREMRCWDRQQCGRHKCATYPENEHNYVVPCECAAGDKKRGRQRTPDEALTSIGRTQKKRGGFSRMGQ